MATESKGARATPVSLDASLDDIDDLPGFTTFPSGAHLCTIENWEQKEINQHPAIQIDLKFVELMELTEVLPESERPPVPGDVQSLSYMLDNDFGAGNLKSFLKPLATHFGTTSIKDTLNASKGANIVLVQKRTEKNDRQYANVKNITVV